MADRDTYLFYTLSDDAYTSKFSIDISMSEKIFKNAIISRAHPIIHMDLVPGNFVISFRVQGIKLFKVITVTDTCFTVAHENNEIIVFYEKHEYLECICPDLRTAFTHKLSKSDIFFVINRIKEGIDQYNEIADTLRSDHNTIIVKPTITRSTSIDLHSVEDVPTPHMRVSSSKFTLSKSPFVTRISDYVEDTELYLGTDVYVGTSANVSTGEPKIIVRKLGEYVQDKSISIKEPKSILKASKAEDVHWFFRLATYCC